MRVEDLVGGLSPCDRAAFVVCVEVDEDRRAPVRDARVRSALNNSRRRHTQEPFHETEPAVKTDGLRSNSHRLACPSPRLNRAHEPYRVVGGPFQREDGADGTTSKHSPEVRE